MNSHNNVYITSETLPEDKLTKFQKQFTVKNSVYTMHAPNEKDAMTSRCLDRKEVQCPIFKDDFFCRLAGRSVPTGLAIVHWIGCINAIKFQFV